MDNRVWHLHQVMWESDNVRCCLGMSNASAYRPVVLAHDSKDVTTGMLLLMTFVTILLT